MTQRVRSANPVRVDAFDRPFTVGRLATRWAFHYETVLLWIHAGQIPAVKVGRKWLIDADWVKAAEKDGWTPNGEADKR